jgi:hypothetical protein
MSHMIEPPAQEGKRWLLALLTLLCLLALNFVLGGHHAQYH